MIGKLSLKVATAASLVAVGGVGASFIPSAAHSLTANGASAPALSSLTSSNPASKVSGALSSAASMFKNPVHVSQRGGQTTVRFSPPALGPLGGSGTATVGSSGGSFQSSLNGPSGSRLSSSGSTSLSSTRGFSTSSTSSATSGSAFGGTSFGGKGQLSGSMSPSGGSLSAQSQFRGGGVSSESSSGGTVSLPSSAPNPLTSLPANPLSSLSQAMPSMNPSSLMSGLKSGQAGLSSLSQGLQAFTGIGQ